MSAPFEILSTELKAPGLSAAIARIIQLLTLAAGDPSQAERAVVIGNNISVVDTAFSLMTEAANNQQIAFSSALITFKAASGLGYFDVTGGTPAADGSRGLEIAAGGGTLEIEGAENIRNFRVIAATGNTMTFSYLLFQAATFAGNAR